MKPALNNLVNKAPPGGTPVPVAAVGAAGPDVGGQPDKLRFFDSNSADVIIYMFSKGVLLEKRNMLRKKVLSCRFFLGFWRPLLHIFNGATGHQSTPKRGRTCRASAATEGAWEAPLPSAVGDPRIEKQAKTQANYQ